MVAHTEKMGRDRRVEKHGLLIKYGTSGTIRSEDLYAHTKQIPGSHTSEHGISDDSDTYCACL